MVKIIQFPVNVYLVYLNTFLTTWSQTDA